MIDCQKLQFNFLPILKYRIQFCMEAKYQYHASVGELEFNMEVGLSSYSEATSQQWHKELQGVVDEISSTLHQQCVEHNSRNGLGPVPCESCGTASEKLVHNPMLVDGELKIEDIALPVCSRPVCSRKVGEQFRTLISSMAPGTQQGLYCAVCHATSRKVVEEEDTSLLRCSRCKNAWYCSTSCQRSHWPTHKVECIPA